MVDSGQEEIIRNPQPVVSIIVPALNEEDTIVEVIERLLKLDLHSEIIVVNDGSTDKTAQLLAPFASLIVLLHHEKPQGKGMAIRSAIKVATAPIVIVQDADLEYAPEQIFEVIAPIQSNLADVVLGSRFQQGFPKEMAFPNKIVNILLAACVRVLYGNKITDEATCYKAIRTEHIRQMELECTGFEFCPEVVSKSFRLNLRLVEVPIFYRPRTIAAGKKIRWTDAPIAFLTLIKYRFWKPK